MAVPRWLAVNAMDYEVGLDGELTMNTEEAKVVSWIFEWYLADDSLGEIAAGLESRVSPPPTGRPKWNREAIDKLLGECCFKKQSALVQFKLKTMALWSGISIPAPMRLTF